MWWKKILGVLLLVLGVYIIYIEISMAISETSLLQDIKNLVSFIVFLLIAFGSVYIGMKFLR